jgi:hypothetical protein
MKICPVGIKLLLAGGRTDMANRTRLERIQFNDQNYNTLFDKPATNLLPRKFLLILLLVEKTEFITF